MTDEEIMHFIVRETKKAVSEEDAGPFGAAVVLDSEIIATGFNSCYKESDPTAHGEIVAIRNAARKLGPVFPEGCVLYTTSQSCPMCIAAAMWAGIKNIYMSATSEDGHEAGLSDRKIYSYLRGDEDPEVLTQKIICPGLARKELLGIQ